MDRPSMGSPWSVGLLQDHLLVQAAADDADEALLLANRPGSGIVLTGADSVDKARRVRRQGFEGPLLLDRRRYGGNGRALAQSRFDRRWLECQRELGVATVLTDSGYVDAGDLVGLCSILDQASEAGEDVVAVLPLHQRWLREDCSRLVTEIGQRRARVALVLEHKSDPLQAHVAVGGLVDLLRTPASIGLLSCDTSALGALAFGADWAAVGVRTKLRHLYPVSKGFHPSDGMHSALVPAVLSMIKVDKIAAAWARTSDNLAWICSCGACQGQTLDWLWVASEFEANQHTFDVLLGHRDELVRLSSRTLREQSWRAQCKSAEFQFYDLGLVGVGWKISGFLKSWQRV